MLRRKRTTGFTFVELCLGLVITGMIATAVASFMLSVSASWRASGQLQSATIRANQFTERFASRLRGAQRIGFWSDGGSDRPGLIFWTDLNNDGVMVYTELTAMQYEAVTQTVDLYLPVLAPGDTDIVWDSMMLTDPTAIQEFIKDLTPQPMARNVTSATLAVSNEASTDVAPSATWTLGLTETDNTTVSRACSASLRGPATPP